MAELGNLLMPLAGPSLRSNLGHPGGTRKAGDLRIGSWASSQVERTDCERGGGRNGSRFGTFVHMQIAGRQKGWGEGLGVPEGRGEWVEGWEADRNGDGELARCSGRGSRERDVNRPGT